MVADVFPSELLAAFFFLGTKFSPDSAAVDSRLRFRGGVPDLKEKYCTSMSTRKSIHLEEKVHYCLNCK